MIRLKNLLIETTPTHGSPPIDGKSKTNAKSWVFGKVNKFTKGFFSDEYWQPLQTVYKEFERLGLNWTPTGNRYEEERIRLPDGSHASVPVRKLWDFEITFINNRDKEDTLYGHIICAGAGPVETPLDRYDVVLTIS